MSALTWTIVSLGLGCLAFHLIDRLLGKNRREKPGRRFFS